MPGVSPVDIIVTVEPSVFPVSVPEAEVVKLLLAAVGGADVVNEFVFIVRVADAQVGLTLETPLIVTCVADELGEMVVKVPVPGVPCVKTTLAVFV